LAASGWPKTVSVVRKAIKGEQGKGGLKWTPEIGPNVKV
jgi:hypothetical protein